MSTATAQPRRSSPPTDNEQLIFQWVKLEGKSQTWVAELFGVNQSTVSRIIQRVERWQAHAAEREGGRLDHTERLRYQRWLTFERNEQIIATCLRIAENLERSVDGTRSTTLYPQRSPTQETKVRTEHFVLDRTGTVCRFLRLAHKIGMDQLKLSHLAPPPPPNPLSDQELADEQRNIAAIQADFAEAKRRSAERLAEEQAEQDRQARELKHFQELEDAERRELAAKVGRAGPDRPESPIDDDSTDTSDPSTLNLEPETLNSASPDHSSAAPHNVHNSCTSQNDATTDKPCTCAPPPAPKKKSKRSRITAAQSWEGEAPAEPHPTNSTTDNHHPRTSRRRKRTKSAPIAVG